MRTSLEWILIVFSSLIILSILTIKLWNRFGIPVPDLIFVTIGIVAGMVAVRHMALLLHGLSGTSLHFMASLIPPSVL
jgi:NhaP-type Na+/H+ and K+/H+ antiporter